MCIWGRNGDPLQQFLGQSTALFGLVNRNPGRHPMGDDVHWALGVGAGVHRLSPDRGGFYGAIFGKGLSQSVGASYLAKAQPRGMGWAKTGRGRGGVAMPTLPEIGFIMTASPTLLAQALVDQVLSFAICLFCLCTRRRLRLQSSVFSLFLECQTASERSTSRSTSIHLNRPSLCPFPSLQSQAHTSAVATCQPSPLPKPLKYGYPIVLRTQGVRSAPPNHSVSHPTPELSHSLNRRFSGSFFHDGKSQDQTSGILSDVFSPRSRHCIHFTERCFRHSDLLLHSIEERWIQTALDFHRRKFCPSQLSVLLLVSIFRTVAEFQNLNR